MTLPPEFIAGLIAKRDEADQARKRLEDARQSLALLEAELRGWESAARLLNGGVNASAASAPQGPSAQMRPYGDSNLPAMRRQWKTLLAATAKSFPSDLSLDDMERLSVEVGVPANRNTLRSQMSIYAGHGVVERTGTGRYRLTPLGARVVGVALPDVHFGSSPKLDALEALLGDSSEEKPVTEPTKEDEG